MKVRFTINVITSSNEVEKDLLSSQLFCQIIFKNGNSKCSEPVFFNDILKECVKPSDRQAFWAPCPLCLFAGRSKNLLASWEKYQEKSYSS